MGGITVEQGARIPGRRKAVGLAVSTTAAMIAGGGAQAADSIEEIIVTATKRAESLQDVAQSMQAFSTEDIRKQRFVGIDDYAKKIPALSFSSREPGGLSVVFRGVSVSGLAFGENSSSCVYLDEQPVTSGGRNVNPRLIDVERLEALSGPQGTLFGDSCQSGALRIITNKPDPEAFDAWIETGLNGFEEGELGYDLSGMANLPLADGKLALRLVGFASHEAGFIDNVVRPSPGGTYDNADIADDDVNSADVYGGRAHLRWLVNEDWTADFTGIFEHRELDGFGDVNLETSLGDLEQRRWEDDSAEDEWYQVAMSLAGPVGPLDSTLAVSYFDRDFRYEADATDYEFTLQRSACGPYPGRCEFDPARPNRGVTNYYDFGGDPRGWATTEESGDRFSVEARLATPSDSTSRWSGIAGAFYSRDTGKTLFRSYMHDFGSTDFFSYLNDLAFYYDGAYKAATDNWWVGAYDTELEQSSVFGEVGFDITERISLTAGGRWFELTDEFALIQGALQDRWPDPGEAPIWTNTSVETSESGDAYKFSVKWEIDDDRMVYATYSEGFRNGGGNPIRRDSKLPLSYDSDFLYNYEVGAKTTWLDGRVLFNVTAYHMDWIDIQVQVEDPRPGIFALAFVNFPEAELEGVETEFQWLISDSWELSSSAAWNSSEISKTSTLFARSGFPFTVLEGTPLPLSPEFKGAVGLQYTLPFTLFGASPYLKLDYSYTGESYNSIGSEAVIVGSPPQRQDDYSLVDFVAGIETEGWSAQFFIDNLLDERAEQFFNNRWGKTRLSINDPRAVGVIFRKNF